MNSKAARTTVAVIAALAVLSLTVPSSAQQKMAPAAPSAPAVQQAPAMAQAPAAPAPAPAVQAPAPPVAAAPRPPRPRRRSRRAAGRAREQAVEGGHRGAARIVAVVDVHVGRRAGQGGHDRSCLCLAGDLDHLHRQDDRDDVVSGASCVTRSARSATPARWRKRNSRSAPRAACCRRCSRPRCAKRGCRRAFPATPASRSARPRALPKSCAPKRGGSGSAWDCWRPSARRRLSSDCSARSGAS